MDLHIFIVVLSLLVTVNGDRTSQKIYYNIKGFEACFRRLNATGQIGCRSNIGGNTGVVHYIETPADLAWLVDKGPHKPYVALLTPETFTWEVVSKLRESGKINGILVIHTNISRVQDNFSPDLTCPNDLNSLYKDDPEYAHCKAQKWNPDANSLFFQDYEFPIMALTNSTEVQEGFLENCYEKFNKPQDGEAPSYPLCSAEVKIEMWAAVDSPTCMRRSELNSLLTRQDFCSPLEHSSTYAFVHPINDPNTTKKHEVIVASARMDSFSMFENLYPAADSSVSGIVTLLAAAAALGKVKDTIDSETSKPIMFTILNGEAFDYIGSQRLVYDMLEDEFPWDASKRSEGPPLLKPTDIVQFLEMGQVALLDEGAMWAHTDPLADSKPQAVLDALMAASATVGLTVKEPPQSQPLPPASLQTFLQEASDIAGVVLTDHQAAFTNKYYNSMYDKPETINHVYPDDVNGTERYDYVTPAAKHLTLVANTVARTLFSLSTGNSDTEHVNVTELEVTHLLYCFLVDAKCDLFNESFSKQEFDSIRENHTMNYYILLSNSPIYYIKRMLGYYLSNTIPDVNKTECEKKESDLYGYTWINGPVNMTSEDESRIGRCIAITSNYTIARSPAFEVKDYDYDSNKYSAWTESRWDAASLSLRIFLVPSPTQESAILASGIVLMVLSFGVMFLIKRKAKIIFATNTI